jgi:hypothetical protein
MSFRVEYSLAPAKAISAEALCTLSLIIGGCVAIYNLARAEAIPAFSLYGDGASWFANYLTRLAI